MSLRRTTRARGIVHYARNVAKSKPLRLPRRKHSASRGSVSPDSLTNPAGLSVRGGTLATPREGSCQVQTGEQKAGQPEVGAQCTVRRRYANGASPGLAPSKWPHSPTCAPMFVNSRVRLWGNDNHGAGLRALVAPDLQSANYSAIASLRSTRSLDWWLDRNWGSSVADSPYRGNRTRAQIR